MVLELKREGKKDMKANDFLVGNAIKAGTILENV